MTHGGWQESSQPVPSVHCRWPRSERMFPWIPPAALWLPARPPGLSQNPAFQHQLTLCHSRLLQVLGQRPSHSATLRVEDTMSHQKQTPGVHEHTVLGHEPNNLRESTLSSQSHTIPQRAKKLLTHVNSMEGFHMPGTRDTRWPVFTPRIPRTQQVRA